MTTTWQIAPTTGKLFTLAPDGAYGAPGADISINAYSEPGRRGKAHFLRDGGRFLQAVAVELARHGFNEYRVRANQGGIAVSGSVYGDFRSTDAQHTRYLHVEVSTTFGGTRMTRRTDGVMIRAVWRELATNDRERGREGTNCYLNGSGGSTAVAHQLLREVLGMEPEVLEQLQLDAQSSFGVWPRNTPGRETTPPVEAYAPGAWPHRLQRELHMSLSTNIIERLRDIADELKAKDPTHPTAEYIRELRGLSHLVATYFPDVSQAEPVAVQRIGGRRTFVIETTPQAVVALLGEHLGQPVTVSPGYLEAVHLIDISFAPSPEDECQMEAYRELLLVLDNIRSYTLRLLMLMLAKEHIIPHARYVLIPQDDPSWHGGPVTFDSTAFTPTPIQQRLLGHIDELQRYIRVLEAERIAALDEQLGGLDQITVENVDNTGWLAADTPVGRMGNYASPRALLVAIIERYQQALLTTQADDQVHSGQG